MPLYVLYKRYIEINLKKTCTATPLNLAPQTHSVIITFIIVNICVR